MDAEGYRWAVWIWIAVGAAMLPVLLRRTAPYGRHSQGAGASLPSRLGWLVMEAPSVWVPPACFLASPPRGVVAYVLLALWELHYLNRGLVYPFRIRSSEARMPLLVVASGFLFTLVNGFLNGRSLTVFALRDRAWVHDPRFILGAGLFVAGFLVNTSSDGILLALRDGRATRYAVPTGGLFRYISCPNYAGEIVEWCGWAIATWSLAGLSFAVWTIANLLPRALAHHRWYRERFPEYPPERRALVPRLL
ncbi:MAG: 3-oxo-5-alpha-steroid 4-dehydrogenase [Acidobacteriota bacterium]